MRVCDLYEPDVLGVGGDLTRGVVGEWGGVFLDPLGYGVACAVDIIAFGGGEHPVLIVPEELGAVGGLEAGEYGVLGLGEEAEAYEDVGFGGGVPGVVVGGQGGVAEEHGGVGKSFEAEAGLESGVELLHAPVGFDEAAVDFEGLAGGGYGVGELDIPEGLYCLALSVGDVGEVVGE